jgi:hypothetical protein
MTMAIFSSGASASLAKMVSWTMAVPIVMESVVLLVALVPLCVVTSAPSMPLTITPMSPVEATSATALCKSRLSTAFARGLLASVEATTSLPALVGTRTMKSTITLPSERVRSTSLALTPLPASCAIPCFTTPSKFARSIWSLTRPV